MDVKAKRRQRQWMSKARDAKAIRCQRQEMSKQPDAKGKRCQRQWMSKGQEMSKQSNVKGSGCERQEMSKQSDVKGKRCQSNRMPKATDVKGNGCQRGRRCQSNQMSKAVDAKGKRCQSNQMSKARDVKATGCQRQEISKAMDVKGARDVKAIKCQRQWMRKARDVKGKRCQSNRMPKARDFKGNGCQRQEKSKARDVKGNGCQRQEMSNARDAKGNGCQSKEKSRAMDVKAKRCQRQWMSKARDVKCKGCQRQWMSKARDVKGKGCQRQWMSKARDVRGNGCQRQEMSKQSDVKGARDVKGTGCQRQRMSKELDVKGTGCQRNWMSTVGNWKKTRTQASFSNLQLLEIEGYLAGKLRFHTFNCWNLKDVSHESFVFASSTVGIWRTSRTKASFSHLQLLEFEGRVARKLRFRIFNCWNLKDISHESFVFASSTVGIWRTSGTKASFSHLQLLEFEGRLARKLRFLIFIGWNLKEVSHEMRFWEIEDARNVVFGRFLQDKAYLGWCLGEACPADGCGTRSFVPGSLSNRPRSGTASSGSFSQLELLESEGCLAQKLRFRTFNCWNLKDVSHESFAFASSRVGIWRASRTKASFSHRQRLEFEGRLARKLRFHIFNGWTLKEVSHEMHFEEIEDARNVVSCRTKLVSDDVWGSLSSGRLRNTLNCTGIILESGAQWNCQFRLHFHNLNLQTFKEVLHESFVFASSTVRIWRMSRTKASISHLQRLEFEGRLARKLRFRILKGWNLKDVWHENFDFVPSTVGIWRTSHTKASLSHLEGLEFWRMSGTKASFSHLQIWRTSRTKCVFES